MNRTIAVRVFLAFIVAPLCACVTQPTMYAVNQSRTIQKPYDVLWEDLVRVCAANNVKLKQVSKDSGLIQAEMHGFNNTAADCGGGLFNAIDRRMYLNVFVSRSGRDPLATVNAVFVERRVAWGVVSHVRCNSRGGVEEEILSAVAK